MLAVGEGGAAATKRQRTRRRQGRGDSERDGSGEAAAAGRQRRGGSEPPLPGVRSIASPAPAPPACLLLLAAVISPALPFSLAPPHETRALCTNQNKRGGGWQLSAEGGNGQGGATQPGHGRRLPAVVATWPLSLDPGALDKGRGRGAVCSGSSTARVSLSCPPSAACRRAAGALPPPAMSRRRRWLVSVRFPRSSRAKGREVASLGSQSRPGGRTPGLRRRNSEPQVPPPVLMRLLVAVGLGVTPARPGVWWP